LLQSTIEQILFKKFHLFFKSIYTVANADRDKAFKDKINLIQNQEISQTFDFLDIREKYRLPGKSIVDKNSHGYQYAVEELNKLNHFEHPYDKIV
jgi:hypothetical protein